MTYPILNSTTYPGISGIFQYLQAVSPSFIPLLFFFIFMVVFIGSYFAQLKRSGTGNPAGSFTVAGFVTLVCGFALSLIPNLVANTYLVVVGAVTVVGFIWLSFSQREG